MNMKEIYKYGNKKSLLKFLSEGSCGERGIRTPGTVARTPHFECGPIDHSGISPGPSPTLRPVIRSANIAIFRKKSIFGTKKDSNFYFHPPNVFPDFIAIFVRY